MDNIRTELIKCVIWDLDNTVWKGVLSEGNVEVYDAAVKCIKHLSQMGIVQSICSKNDYKPVKTKLTELGIWDCFVFVSVNWNPKGERVADQIKRMNLRSVNVLFVDDEPIQRQEVSFYCDGIMVSSEKIVDKLLLAKWEKSDIDRLQQYRILEAKTVAKEQSPSREEFLRQSNIKVRLRYDCKKQAKRLYELYSRTNQLNFTKNRVSKSEFMKQLRDRTRQCGYVTVQDNYGDYGIVGFFSIIDSKLVDYLFSCRIIDMGVEQYVYKQLGCPSITIVPPVVSEKLIDSSGETWINDSDNVYLNQREVLKIPFGKHVLLKGPCDLLRACAFIKKKRLKKEVYYQKSDGKFMYAQTCFGNIVSSLSLNKNYLRDEMSRCPFGTMDYFESSLLKKKYSHVFLSVLPIVKFGVYKKREDNFFFQIASYRSDITDPRNYSHIIEGAPGSNYFNNTITQLTYFSERYEKVDYINDYFETHLIEMVTKLKKSRIVFVLGNEEVYLPESQRSETATDIRRLNDIIRRVALQGKLDYIDVNEFISSSNDVIEIGTHYTTPVYYKIAKEIVGKCRNST